MKNSLCFDDVLLVPQFSDIVTRSSSEIDIGFTMTDPRLPAKDLRFETPIISSPMDTITEDDMTYQLACNGGLGIIHRYCSLERLEEIINRKRNDGDLAHVRGVAIGVTGDYLERFQLASRLGVQVFCIDVAHGHHVLVRDALTKLRSYTGIRIIAGNVATLKGFDDLADWGAHGIRVGIGGGCFVPGSKVRTSAGLKNIEDVLVGDLVYTHTGELHRVVDTMIFYRNENLIEINGIVSTKNHEYYVVKKADADKVTEGNLHEYAQWVPAEKISDEYMIIELE